jgi:hypothetical protein
MEFEKQPLTKSVARALRAGTRRQEFDGHRFAYPDLKELWVSDDKIHVLCTHDHDKAWQYWHQVEGSWHPVGAYESREDAEQTALGRLIPPSEEEISEVSGTYLKARFSSTSRWIVTRITGEKTIDELTGIYTRLGCTEIITERVA